MTAPSSASVVFSCSPVTEMPALRETWQHFDLSGSHSFFLTWDWMGTLLRLLPESIAPCVVLAKRNAAVVGLALLTTRTKYRLGAVPLRQLWFNVIGDSAFDCLTLENNGFVGPGCTDPTLLQSLVLAFRGGHFDAVEMIIPGLEQQITSNGLICGQKRSRSYRVALLNALEAPNLAAILSRNARQHLKRSMRDCSQLGALHIESSGDVETSLRHFAALKSFHDESWHSRGKCSAFDSPFFERFHRELIASGTSNGSVEILRVLAGECVLGYLYNFHRNGVVYSYQSGFNPALAHLRPGYVCHALAIEHYANRGASIYDFLAGHNQLKQTFATDTYEMSWYRLRRPTAYFRAEAAIRSVFGIS